MNDAISSLLHLHLHVLNHFPSSEDGLSRFISIPHIYSEKMADKSEVIVLDVLHKNEIKSTDMIQIMREIASYLYS